MKKLNVIKKVGNSKIVETTSIVAILFISHSVYAQAPQQTTGLKKAASALQTLKDQLDLIIPVAAAVILLCLAIGYAGRFIERDTFLRWSVGVILAGSAAEISKMFFDHK
ncbi:VirB2 family type IV secretion system major pilin TrwL [Bartonella sp. CB189]|uniref:VirB2 family type IV secretion system major pilin TrwL n=1 Tax=Bartonella sp. CB189 TaxID=3112254 RepID=UPI002F96A181